MENESPIESKAEAPHDDKSKCIKNCAQCELGECGNEMRRIAKYGSVRESLWSPYIEEEEE